MCHQRRSEAFACGPGTRWRRSFPERGRWPAAAAELEAEKRRQEEAPEDEEDTKRVYDLRDLGASKQLPNVGRAIETLERKKPRHELNGSSMVDTSLQQQSTTDMKLRSQVALTPREKRSILKHALCGCIGDAWYSLIEASPCVHRFCIRCCCRCCRRPQQRRQQQRVVEETASSSSSERTPEIPVTRGRRGSVGRVSLSSCTAAEAMADGLERGLDPEQVLAIREFWNFQGAETELEDYEERKPYKVALRADRGDPSLSSRYKSDAAGGNIVTEKVMQARTYNEEEDAAERMEVHTLKFHPPTRKRIKMEIPPDDDEMESAEEENLDEDASEEADDVIAADEDDKPADSGRDASDPESDEDSSSSESASSAAKGMSALASALDTDSKINPLMQEIEQIRELDADEVRAAVRRAKERPEYQAVHNRRTEEEGPDEGPKAQAKLAEPLPKQLDVCTILPWS